MKYSERRMLEDMPFDMVFEDWDGCKVSCHATGYEVYGHDCTWWNEYIDSDGNLYYGR